MTHTIYECENLSDGATDPRCKTSLRFKTTITEYFNPKTGLWVKELPKSFWDKCVKTRQIEVYQKEICHGCGNEFVKSALIMLGGKWHCGACFESKTKSKEEPKKDDSTDVCMCFFT